LEKTTPYLVVVTNDRRLLQIGQISISDGYVKMPNEPYDLSSVDGRIAIFKSELENLEDVTGTRRISENFGFSNACTAIEGGMFLGGPDVANMPSTVEEFVLATVFRTIPNCEIYMAFHFTSNMGMFHDRLQSMIELSRGGDGNYSNRNNNLKVYLRGEDGNVYLCNKGTWNSISPIPVAAGQPITVDRVTVSGFTPAKTGSSKWAIRSFIGELAGMLGWDKLHQIDAFKMDADITADMKRLPAKIPWQEISASIRTLGGIFDDDLIRRFHTGFNFHPHKHFVVLSGISGTGKTLLAECYAKAVHGIDDQDASDPLLFICPVRPEWTDPSGLLGYYDVLSDRYVVPYFLQAVIAANANPSSPIFVILDEMNLARVEYYLSDILSIIETREPLRLHSKDIPIEGTFGDKIPAEIPLPSNFFLVGTINVDETTSPLSDKVLDRAVVIDMAPGDIDGFIAGKRQDRPDLSASIDECSQVIINIHKILEDNEMPFGYRVIEEAFLMHHFSKATLDRDGDEVLDEIVEDRILTKLRGTESQRGMLDKLIDILVGKEKCTKRLNSLVRQLDEFGAFQNAR
jgi:5-methylcytosine-specific restriction enzyme B